MELVPDEAIPVPVANTDNTPAPHDTSNAGLVICPEESQISPDFQCF